KDAADGSNAVSQNIRKLGQDVKNSTSEATGTLALLGEQIGITIPRHLRTFIAEIPGVGAALDAAFSSVAILALAGLIGEIVSKLREFQKQAEDVAETWASVGEKGDQALHKLTGELLGLQIQLDTLGGNTLARIQDEFRQIDGQTLDAI